MFNFTKIKLKGDCTYDSTPVLLDPLGFSTKIILLSSVNMTKVKECNVSNIKLAMSRRHAKLQGEVIYMCFSEEFMFDRAH